MELCLEHGSELPSKIEFRLVSFHFNRVKDKTKLRKDIENDASKIGQGEN